MVKKRSRCVQKDFEKSDNNQTFFRILDVNKSYLFM
jgi:hypothetical protein